MVADILQEEPAYFLVDLRIKPTNNVKVFLDGDSGITIDKCVQVNRKLYRKLEEAVFFPDGDFSLEVSSAGLDEPLKSLRQYKKNSGRQVEVLLQDGTQKEGQLKDVTEEERTRWTAEHGTILAVVPPGSGVKADAEVDSEGAVEVAEEEAIAE